MENESDFGYAWVIFLNLPIWANFVDPTDLSPPTTYYLPTLDQPTLFYSLNLNLNLNQAGQAEQVEYCWGLAYLVGLVEVEAGWGWGTAY